MAENPVIPPQGMSMAEVQRNTEAIWSRIDEMRGDIQEVMESGASMEQAIDALTKHVQDRGQRIDEELRDLSGLRIELRGVQGRLDELCRRLGAVEVEVRGIPAKCASCESKAAAAEQRMSAMEARQASDLSSIKETLGDIKDTLKALKTGNENNKSLLDRGLGVAIVASLVIPALVSMLFRGCEQPKYLPPPAPPVSSSAASAPTKP